MGLFLGFSFWECTRATITKMDSFARSSLTSKTPERKSNQPSASLISVVSPNARAVTPYNSSAKSVLKISRGKLMNEDFKIDIVHSNGENLKQSKDVRKFLEIASD